MDGRVRSGTKKGQKHTHLIVEEIELNVYKADTNLCIYCKEFIDAIYEDGRRVRYNRIDCENEKGIVSYHLHCYDLDLLGYVSKATQRKINKIK